MLRDLRGLSKDGAEFVAGHLVAAGSLADEEPELAWLHARAARARGGRIAVVRETVGLVAYRAGEWAEAIGELRAARRMGGGPGHLAVMADSERALGHPERAIELSRSAEADDLDEDAAIELAIVVAGARADLGQIDAALAHLERIGWREDAPNPRIAYAYADLLLQAGRRHEALTWFVRSADADTDEETDAGERLAALSASLDEDRPDVIGEARHTAAGDPHPSGGAVVEFEQVPDGGSDAGEPDEQGESGPAVIDPAVIDRAADAVATGDAVGTDTGRAGVNAVATGDAVGIDAWRAGVNNVATDDAETDEPATTLDVDASRKADRASATDGSATDDSATDDSATEDSATRADDGVIRSASSAVIDDGIDAETPPVPEKPAAAESDDPGVPHAPDGSVTDTDTDRTTGSATATTADNAAEAGNASPSAGPLFVPPLFSDDPLAGDR